VVGSTDGLIGIAVGLPGLRDIASERPADDARGRHSRIYRAALQALGEDVRAPYPRFRDGEIREVGTAALPHPWHYFRDLLLETGHLVPIRDYEPDFLSISSPDVLARIRAGEAGWERFVPPAVADAIVAGGLFGYRGGI
jgi:hypothetical protein